MFGSPYGTPGVGYSTPGFAQPLIYGRGSSPAGMVMMPMLLPDGRIGFVLQQPGAQLAIQQPQPRGGRTGGGGGRSGGGGSSGGRHSNDSEVGRSRYNPY